FSPFSQKIFFFFFFFGSFPLLYLSSPPPTTYLILWVVELADEALERGGKLLEVAEKHYNWRFSG
ncbi:hypothetical protein, partial [Aerosakkonema funiforme]|uniref:hypothetical protein n=1 Tax=Aerosakkonema funiforme TaxID=1246630 RepID=UPI0035BB0400